jgi:hypothetical protein
VPPMASESAISVSGVALRDWRAGCICWLGRAGGVEGSFTAQE